MGTSAKGRGAAAGTKPVQRSVTVRLKRLLKKIIKATEDIIKAKNNIEPPDYEFAAAPSQDGNIAHAEVHLTFKPSAISRGTHEEW